MNERTKNKIIEKLKKIELKEIDSDDIEILLINIREYARIKNFKLLLEFCDFVAHPDRDKGLVYDEIDIVYSKFKYMATIKNGDNIDYNNVPKKVFELLFEKGVDQISDEFLKQNINKTSSELKNYLKTNLFRKEGNVYKITDLNKIDEIRNIQKLCNKPPDIHLLKEHSIFEDIKLCLINLCSEINYPIDLNKITENQNSIMLCFLEIIQNCNFDLHDGLKAKGYITVGKNNDMYEKNPIIDNLNLSFTAEIPIEQSFAIFEVIQTGITIGRFIPNANSLIEWMNKERTFGKLKSFNVSKRE